MSATEETYVEQNLKGYDARLDGKTLLDNPNPVNSDEAAWWAMGWAEADRLLPCLDQIDDELPLDGYFDNRYQETFING